MEPNTCYLYKHRSKADKALRPESWAVQSALSQMNCELAARKHKKNLKEQLKEAIAKRDFANALMILNEAWEDLIKSQMDEEKKQKAKKSIIKHKKIYLYLLIRQKRKQKEKLHAKVQHLKKRMGR